MADGIVGKPDIRSSPILDPSSDITPPLSPSFSRRSSDTVICDEKGNEIIPRFDEEEDQVYEANIDLVRVSSREETRYASDAEASVDRERRMKLVRLCKDANELKKNVFFYSDDRKAATRVPVISDIYMEHLLLLTGNMDLYWKFFDLVIDPKLFEEKKKLLSSVKGLDIEQWKIDTIMVTMMDNVMTDHPLSDHEACETHSD